MINVELSAMKKEFTEFLILDLSGRTSDEVFMNIASFAKAQGLVKNADVLYAKFQEYASEHSLYLQDSIMLLEAHKVPEDRPYAFILCRMKYALDICPSNQKTVRIILASLIRDAEDLSRLKPMLRFVKAFKSEVFCAEFLKAKSLLDVYQALARTIEKGGV